MPLNRRQFTSQLAAGAALPAVAAPLRSRSQVPQTVEVLVIGAGLSGLHSALLLEELGAQVQVIEARRRIGGRVYTLHDRPGPLPSAACANAGRLG